ncbi:8540_t:CDS:2 [Ambispora leptoticha]|uniref:8540_t:CDS:1 n=1 Tax=Ambispora leptoticha TaxID=144679 RepID=A0A9N9BC70_9GLOM|nr:8540_t:CDS:2 [Ambispora leptoticha]
MGKCCSKCQLKDADNDNSLTLLLSSGKLFPSVSENPVYPIPEEIDRLQTLHYLFRSLWQSNYSSPIEDSLTSGGLHVLDVGCGPGTWILEMATTYKLSHFTGVDISTMFPNEVKPRNVAFVEGNLRKGLNFADNTFDFVYMRCSAMEYTDKQWEETVINELIRVTKPGGWIEFMEMDIRFENQGPAASQLQNFYEGFSHSKGVNNVTSLFSRIPRYLEATNQMNTSQVHREERKEPIGKWGGRFGELAINNFATFYRLIRQHLVPIMGITNDQYEEIVETFIKEVEEHKTYAISSRVFAQKKGGDESLQMQKQPQILSTSPQVIFNAEIAASSSSSHGWLQSEQSTSHHSRFGSVQSTGQSIEESIELAQLE